jgi:hypothetical protein
MELVAVNRCSGGPKAGVNQGEVAMFFRKRVDGVDFGEFIAYETAQRVPRVLFRSQSILTESILDIDTFDPHQSDFNFPKFLVIWLMMFRDLTIVHLEPSLSKKLAFGFGNFTNRVILKYKVADEVDGLSVIVTNRVQEALDAQRIMPLRLTAGEASHMAVTCARLLYGDSYNGSISGFFVPDDKVEEVLSTIAFEIDMCNSYCEKAWKSYKVT